MILSIIVALYNDRENLNRFLGRITFATLDKRIEFLFIDDGSSDFYDDIIEGENISNSLLIKQTNGRQGKARNNGLGNAQGIYVWFVDVDDIITNLEIDRVFKDVLNNTNDVLFYDAICEGVILRSNIKNSSKNDLLKMLAWNTVTVAAWNKVYNRIFLLKNDIWFIENRKFEDLYFAIVTCLKMNSWNYSPSLIYTYLINHNSTTNTFNEQIVDVFYVLMELKHVLIEKHKDIYIQMVYVHGLKYTLIRLLKSKNLALVKYIFESKIVVKVIAEFPFRYQVRMMPIAFLYKICIFFCTKYNKLMRK